jgi:hypothetical protein
VLRHAGATGGIAQYGLHLVHGLAAIMSASLAPVEVQIDVSEGEPVFFVVDGGAAGGPYTLRVRQSAPQ